MKNKTILITGGTGSFGKEYLKLAISEKVKKIIIFSRDELKQFELKQKIDKKYISKIRFFIGDVRDYERLKFAFNDVDYVIHAAALKQVDTCEYNPFEAVKTNILGSQNIINAAIETGVQKVIGLSTDKASSPINLYGSTKLAADKLFVSANYYRGDKNLKFSVVRYGNVLNSRGSVLPTFLRQKIKSKFFHITHPDMTRFNITLKEGVNFVNNCLKIMQGGELFVPKLPSFKITELAKAIDPKKKIKIIGIRPGEKLHEEMISENESNEIIDMKKYYVVLPIMERVNWNKKFYTKKGKLNKKKFSYNSLNNNNYLNNKELKILLKEFL